MNEKLARTILGTSINDDNSLSDLGMYLSWDGESKAALDGQFSSEELDAISWWMVNMEVVDDAPEERSYYDV